MSPLEPDKGTARELTSEASLLGWGQLGQYITARLCASRLGIHRPKGITPVGAQTTPADTTDGFSGTVAFAHSNQG